MSESLDQILELIKKTGDRCVIIDRVTNQNYVVMSIKDYEYLRLPQEEARPLAVQELNEEEMDQKLDAEVLSAQPLAAPTQAKTDWWEDKVEKPQPLEDKPVDDQYYLEPVES